jgi:hypothetical protein
MKIAPAALNAKISTASKTNPTVSQIAATRVKLVGIILQQTLPVELYAAAEKKYSCAWYHDVSHSKAAELVLNCIKKHEDEHYDSLTCPENGLHVFEFFDDGVDVHAEEIHAHNVEFDCLLESLNQCNSDSDCIND